MSITCWSRLEKQCDCGGVMRALATSATHDPKQIDLIVECDDCGKRLNTFVPLADMQRIDEGEG